MKVKMAMVGGGKDAFIGAVHRKAAALDNNIEFVAGALSSNPKKAKASGKALGLKDERNYGTWQELLEKELARPDDERIDFVTIVTPNHLHFPIAKAFASAGIHVVCDKPLVHSSSEAAELIDIVKAKKSLFAVTYNYTGYPMVKEARERIARGELGHIRKLIVEYNQGWLASNLELSGQKQAAWRTDPSKSGLAGAIGDIGSHAENLASTITGLELSQLCADLTHFVDGRQLDDDGTVLLRYSSGAKGVLIASQIAIGEENNLRIRVYGSKGSLAWQQETPNTLNLHLADQAAQTLSRGHDYLSDAAKEASRLPPGHPEAFIEAFANIYLAFAKTIEAKRSGKSYQGDFPSLIDGARGVKFIEKTVESSRSEKKWTDF